MRLYIICVFSVQNRNCIEIVCPIGSVTADRSLQMINTITFKGKWSQQFDPFSTMPVPFYVSPSERVTVGLMYLEKRFPYVKLESIDAHAVAIPFKVC